MFKFLTYIVLSYFFYKYFIKPNFLPAGDSRPSNLKSKSRKAEKPKEEPRDGEYIDYEEVD
jgi:hypothetical protein